MKNKKLSATLAVLILMLVPVIASALTVDPAFNANKLIEDKVFSDTETFGGAPGIQKFLETKGSVLANTSPEFLTRLKEPSNVALKTGLEDPQPNLPRLRTAAELIWDAGKQSGLNPQAILVILNKEQGLITQKTSLNDSGLQTAIDHAMGMNCGDAVGCWSVYPGFYHQIFGNFDADGNRYLGAAKSLMKSFQTVGGRGPSYNGAVSHVGETIILDNTMGAYDGITPQQSVTLANSATAALYRFTPHVFNGNYNFWKYMNEWFRYANGTLIKLSTDNNTYIIQNGTRQQVPPFVAQARGLNLASSITVSPNELSGYPQDKIYGPADNTIVKVTGSDQFYVFIDNTKHPASQFVIDQRGLSVNTALTITPDESNLFQVGSTLTPKDGTIVRGQTQAAVYLVDKGSLKLFSAFTFAQRKVAKQVQVIPDSEVDSYPKLGFVPPLDNTLVRAGNSPTVYLIADGLKHPVSGEIFKNRKFSFKNVASISPDEIAALSDGSFATPSDKTFFKIAGSPGIYMFKEGSKHLISDFVAKQRSITPDYTFTPGEAGAWLDGIAVAPRDGTLIRGDKDLTIYLVSAGQLRGLTGQAFKNRKYSLKNVKVIPQAEVDSYGKGEVLEK